MLPETSGLEKNGEHARSVRSRIPAEPKLSARHIRLARVFSKVTAGQRGDPAVRTQARLYNQF